MKCENQLESRGMVSHQKFGVDEHIRPAPICAQAGKTSDMKGWREGTRSRNIKLEYTFRYIFRPWQKGSDLSISGRVGLKGSGLKSRVVK